jgi:DNA-binding response OmpR family regulator
MEKELLLLEDNVATAKIVKMNLQKDGFIVWWRKSGREALDFASRHHSRLGAIILDINLPDLRGNDVCEILRNKGIETPILMLTAIGDNSQIVRSLDSGADDYLVKPFSYAVLKARINCLLRRPVIISDASVVKLNWTFNELANKLEVGERSLSLTGKEKELFKCLFENANYIVSREKLKLRVWGDAEELHGNSIEVYVKRLRDILQDQDRQLIQTVRGVGYKLNLARS